MTHTFPIATVPAARASRPALHPSSFVVYLSQLLCKLLVYYIVLLFHCRVALQGVNVYFTKRNVLY